MTVKRRETTDGNDLKESKRQRMFYSKKRLLIFVIVPLLLIVAYLLPTYRYRTYVINVSNSLSSGSRSEGLSSNDNRVAIPCIEPHCDIECSITYQSYERDGILRKASLDKTQQQHLMIDLGEDRITQELLSATPLPKICPYRQTSKNQSEETAATTVQFYPLLFGFVDHYLPKTTPRSVLINNQIRTVDQICLPKKTKDFSDLIPGKIVTYKFGFESELDYRRLYTAAYFAVTTRKGGWDCNRHYEILSSGTIPYFDDLSRAGNHTLSILPKSLLYEAKTIPGVDRRKLSIDHKLFDIKQYNLLLHRLLYYATHRLTTVKVVQYILKTIQYPLTSSNKHSVLYISHEQCDYMKDFMLHGFTRIFEENLHVFRPPTYMYEYPSSKIWNMEETGAHFRQRLYGFGYGYKLTLKNYAPLFERDRKELSTTNTVEENIKNKTYSLVIFGSILRSHDLFPLVREHYQRAKIVLIDGEDEGKHANRSEYAKWGTYFLREIPDNCDAFMWSTA